MDILPCDLFVNVAGGLSVDDPAADLACVASLASSFRDRSIPARTLVLGEVGLAGEVRAVSQPEARLAEAARLGFERALIPSANARHADLPRGSRRSGSRRSPTRSTGSFDGGGPRCSAVDDLAGPPGPGAPPAASPRAADLFRQASARGNGVLAAAGRTRRRRALRAAATSDSGRLARCRPARRGGPSRPAALRGGRRRARAGRPFDLPTAPPRRRAVCHAACTARRHLARCASRSTAFILGWKRFPTLQAFRISSRSFQTPVARPARKAAPSAVVSTMRGRSTGTSSRSAWNCMSRSFCDAPPSTLKTGMGLPPPRASPRPGRR